MVHDANVSCPYVLVNRGNTKRACPLKMLCLMFVYVCFVLGTFVSGQILENLWFGDLYAE